MVKKILPTLALLPFLCAWAGARPVEPVRCGPLPTHADFSTVAGPSPASFDLPTPTPKLGKLRVKVFRLSFPDIANTLDRPTQETVHKEVNAFYHAMSRGAFQWEFSFHSEVFMAPKVAASYGFDQGSAIFDLIADLDKKQKAVGGFDVSVTNFPRIKQWDGTYIPWSGSVYINGEYDTAVVAHELGHSLGLPHANGIDAGTEVLGTLGNQADHVEYGNPFDNMGFTPSFGHFHVQSKWRLGWLPATEVREIKNTGIYRLFAHDQADQVGRLVGIRIPAGNRSNGYWIEYRATPEKARPGALVHLDFYEPDFDGLHLLDMTPGTQVDNAYHPDAADGALTLGKAWKDKLASVELKVLAVNSGAANREAYVDVQVTIPGSIPIAIRPRTSLHVRPHPFPVLGALYDVRGRFLAGLPAYR